MTKKQKKVLYRIIIASILLIVLHFLPVSGMLAFGLYLIPYFVIGYDILRKAFLGIIRGQVFDENFLMAVATVGAMALAVYEELTGGEGEFAEGVAVMLFYQIGELFQAVAVGKSRRNITALMDIRPDYANIEGEDGKLEQVDPDDVEIGTVIVVQPGEKVPIDGIVTFGSSTLNTSALTGESVPRSVKEGEEIISGCINLSGLLKIQTTKEFGESTVSKILDLVENSSMKKSKSENFISKFAKIYTPAVCIGALVLAILPPVILLLLGKPAQFPTWIIRALTFLVISCPCALVISIPLSFFGGIGGASASGILVKGSNYLEAMAQARYVVFDKTGTLTRGTFEVTEICPSKELLESCGQEVEKARREILEYAAYAESYSTHPISKSLKEAYAKTIAEDEAIDAGKADPEWKAIANGKAGLKRKTNVAGKADPNGKTPDAGKDWQEAMETGNVLQAGRVTDAQEISGHGVSAAVDGKSVSVGNAKLMKSLGLAYEEAKGVGTVVYVAVDGVYAGYVLIADVIKDHAKEALAGLKAAGIKKTIMLTGDNKAVAEHVAKELGIDEVKSELLPADKVAAVEELLAAKGEKENLAFVGDGINDAPVLSRADVGIAMGALGSDAAIEAADIVLMDDDPAKIALTMKIARKCLRIVYENITFALAVKGLCLILGAFGIANMWMAIFADVGVMVLAVLNAIRCLKVSDR
ncbi:MAG: heavy metal translocating P-type ATPase [Acetatifactor sp.]|nr:heavy metal translocating P-type ATPase [Acetatifactor sp.]